MAKLTKSFEFRMNSDEVVLPQEELFIYTAQKIDEKNFLVYCKNSKKARPNIHTERYVQRNIEEGYWKVIN